MVFDVYCECTMPAAVVHEIEEADEQTDTLGQHYFGQHYSNYHYAGQYCLGQHRLGQHLGQHYLGQFYLGQHYSDNYSSCTAYSVNHCLDFLPTLLWTNTTHPVTTSANAAQARRTASIIAGIPCSCCFLGRADFELACGGYPEAADQMHVIASARFGAIWAP